MLDRMIGNLQGLQNLSNQARQAQQQEKLQNDTRLASDKLRAYRASLESGTPDETALIDAIMLSPDLSQNVLSGIGLADKQRQQRAADDFVRLHSSLDNPELFNKEMARRVDSVMASGGDPSDSLNLTKIYNEQGPEAARKAMLPIGAALANQGYIKPELIGFGGGADERQPAAVAEFEFYQKLQQNNPKAADAFGRARGYINSAREENKTEKQRDYEQWQKLKVAGDPSAESFGRAAGFESKAESQANTAMRQQEAKQGAIDLNAITKESRSARSTLNTLDQLSKLEQSAFENFSGTKLFTSRLASQLGIDIDGLAESEAFEAVATGVVLDKAQQMAGALSNADMVFLQNSAPALSQTSEGRRQLIEYGKKLAQRQIDYAQEAAKFRSKNGYFDITQFETEFRNKKDDLFKGGKAGSASPNGESEQEIYKKYGIE